jgi:hypothetical protein
VEQHWRLDMDANLLSAWKPDLPDADRVKTIARRESARNVLYVRLALIEHDLMSFYSASAKRILARSIATDVKDYARGHNLQHLVGAYTEDMQPCGPVGSAPTSDGLEVGI